jgi:hypothetical protein
MDAAVFLDLGNKMMKRHNKLASESEKRRFHATFGTGAEICSLLWAKIDFSTVPLGAKPKHLLWGLMFLKLYCSESVHCTIAGGVDETTFRKWSWIFVEAIAVLHEDLVRD